MNKVEVYNLIKNKKELNLTYRDISLRSGYHMKSLIRIGKNIDYYISKLDNDENTKYVLSLSDKKDKTYKELYFDYLDVKSSNKLSFSGFYKLLKKHNIETCFKNRDKKIKIKRVKHKRTDNIEYRKILLENKFQYKNKLYKIMTSTNFKHGKIIIINKSDLNSITIDGKHYKVEYIKNMPSLKGVAYFRHKTNKDLY